MEGNKTYEAVVIGGSWGGTEALIQILKDLPASFALPIIVVLHRQKNTISFLIEILSKRIHIPVKEVEEKEAILSGFVYIAPPNYHILIEQDRTFSLDVSQEISYSRPSIDVLFESAALVYKHKLVGILLTGANADGSEGMSTIAKEKGLTVVQDPDDAESNIMPKAALSKVKVDHVLTKPQISELLLSLNA
jgi:two-component system, chemotaxis family, protein-glutamate methylesterase/glutaminase